MENYDNLREYISENLTNSKCAIECLIFLYSNKEKTFVYNEIWEEIRKKVIISGSTPVQTCATEIRKYTENSPISIKRSPSLFKITNLDAEGEFQKFKLMEDIRKKIDIFLKSKKIISKREFIESLKDLLEYSQTILKFFNLTEENNHLFIDEIYKNNNLEYFETFNKEFNKEQPIQFLRHIILSQFIEDKRRNFENTKVNIDFIKNNIETLWTKEIDGKKFDKSSFDSRWTNNYYVRVLLTFYDFKYKHDNRKKILNIIKFLLRELNLEDVNYLNDLEIDENGKIGLKTKELKTKIVELNNVKFSIIDFKARANNAYSWDPWIAIYPAYFKDHQNAYQLFLQLNELKENEIQIGLYPGGKLVTNKCKDNKNLKPIILNFNNENLVEEIVDFYKKVLPDYKKLNELEKEYHDYDKINYWFGSPQPPKNEVYEENMFAEMMEKGYYALGWGEFQENMTQLSPDQIKNKTKEIWTKKSDKISYHLYMKGEMKEGDIIIAKKGDRPQNPDNRIYGIGIIKSEYQFDKTFDKYNTHNSHYRKVDWFINFYKDYRKEIIQNPYLDLKNKLEEPRSFQYKTIVKKDYDFYLNLKKGIITKLTELKNNKLIKKKDFDNYLKQFKELEDNAKCVKAYLSESIIRSLRINYWIFQSNPDKFDLETAIKELNKDTFSVNQYKEEIIKGDIVLFWVSGEKAGIVGWGEVLTNPEVQEPNPKAKKFTFDPTLSGKKLRVMVSYNSILPKILKSDLVKNYPKIASQLTIISAPQGTNFKIREIDWNFFKNNLFFDEISKEAITHLIAGRNLVFYGPPGTGKTRRAIKITEMFCSKKNYIFETAHAEWTAYNVVGGPIFAGVGKLTFKPGFLTLAAKKCGESLNRDKNDINSPYWLIIDEINRANLDLAFGKIFTLLDIDYRKEPILDESELEGLDNIAKYKDLIIPKEFRILATMNTYDKAILFSLGYAFRRRFAFIEIGSPFAIEEERQYTENKDGWNSEVEKIGDDKLKRFLKEIDDWIKNLSTLKLFNLNSLSKKIYETNNDIKNGVFNPYNPYKFSYKLGKDLFEKEIIEVGYAQPIDLIKYVLLKVNLFPEDNKKIAIIKAIDDSVKAYFIPHIEYYLPKARRLKTLGESDKAENAQKNLEDIKNLFENLGLKKSNELMEKIISNLESGITRML